MSRKNNFLEYEDSLEGDNDIFASLVHIMYKMRSSLELLHATFRDAYIYEIHTEV